MIVRRSGKCDVCQAVVLLTKEFISTETVDLFNPAPATIKGKLARQIKKWRDKKDYCDKHQPKGVLV